MKYLIASLTLLFSLNLSAQSDIEHDVAAYLIEGIGYVHMGKPDKAIGVFESIIDLDPANSSAQYGLAKAYLEKEDISTAEQHLELALNSTSTEKAYYLYQWSEETRRAGLYDHCGNSYKKLFSLSDDINDLNKSIYCYELAEEYQMALDVLNTRNEFAGMTPSSGKKKLQLLRQIGDQPAYKEALNVLIESFPEDIEFLEVGLEIAQSNDDEKRKKELSEKILKLRPYHPEALSVNNDRENTLNVEDSAIPLDAKIASILRDLSAYLETPKENKAEALLKKADQLLQAHSSEPKAVSMVADVYFNTGYIQRALPLYKRLTVSSPQIKPVWDQYITCLVLLDDYDQIIAAQNDWSAYYPIDLYLQLCTAYALLQQKENVLARPLLDQSEMMIFDDKSEESIIFLLLKNSDTNKRNPLNISETMVENWFVLLHMSKAIDYPVSNEDKEILSKSYSKNNLLNLDRNE